MVRDDVELQRLQSEVGHSVGDCSGLHDDSVEEEEEVEVGVEVGDSWSGDEMERDVDCEGGLEGSEGEGGGEGVERGGRVEH